jgi:hypothetical protein
MAAESGLTRIEGLSAWSKGYRPAKLYFICINARRSAHRATIIARFQ